MHKHIFIAFALLLTFCPATPAERPAGTVLYFKSGDETYLLLADHAGRAASRGWASFGGGPQDGESPAQTATRETEEETRGFFLQRDLLKSIEHHTPAIDDIGFASYFIEIPFAPPQRVGNNRPPDNELAYNERGPYAWIPFSAIEKYLQDEIDGNKKYPVDIKFLPAASNTDWFWPVWLASLKNAMALGAVPWQQPQQQK